MKIGLTLPDLHEIAAQLGITITEHHGGLPGWYCHTDSTISIRNDLSIAMAKSVLAHELAHAYYGDEPGHDDERLERRADQWAAHLLISPTEYELAESIYGPYPGAIASELEVTLHLVQVWAQLQPTT